MACIVGEGAYHGYGPALHLGVCEEARYERGTLNYFFATRP